MRNDLFLQERVYSEIINYFYVKKISTRSQNSSTDQSAFATSRAAREVV